MGSTESTLTRESMEAAEAATTIANTHAAGEMDESVNSNTNINRSATNELEAKNHVSDADINKSDAVTLSGQRQRRVTADTEDNDDAWWWEIENENLILDQMTTLNGVGENSQRAHLHADIEEQIQSSVLKSVATTSKEFDDASMSLQSTQEVGATAVFNKSQRQQPISVDTAPESTLEEFKEELRLKRLARQTVVQDLRDEINALRKQLATEQALTRRLRSSPGAERNAQREASIENAPCYLSTKTGVVEQRNEQQQRHAEVDEKQEDKEEEKEEENGHLATAGPDVDTDDEDPMSRSRHANIELANAQLALQLANAENISLRTEVGVVQKQVVTLKEVVACCKQMLAVKEEQCTQVSADRKTHKE